MTIAVIIKVHDGLVLASDSASSLSMTGDDGNAQIINVWNHQNKIFNLYKGLPIGAMTYGSGSIGHASIATLSKDLRRRFTTGDHDKKWIIEPKNYTLEKIASLAKQFFDEKLDALSAEKSQQVNLGFYVAGYSAGAERGELWDIRITNGKCLDPILIRGQGDNGVSWAGEPEAITRLLFGYATNLPDALLDLGLKPEAIEEAKRKISQKTQISLAFDPMPIQDALDLGEFLVELTAKFTRFKLGAGTVGGPTELAAITKHEGYKWVKRKHYFSSDLNREHSDA